MLDFLIFAVVLVLFLLVAVIYLYPGSAKISTIPGFDASDEIEGNLPDIAKCGSLHEFLVMLHGLHGDIASFWFGPTFTVSIASHELFKEHSHVFDRPYVLFEMLEELIGPESIQFANGADGRSRHVAYGRCFSDEAVKKYYKILNDLTENYIKSFSKIPKDEHVPLQERMFCFTFTNMLRCAFGTYFDDEVKVQQLNHSYELLWLHLENRLTGNQAEEGSDEQKLFEKHKAALYDIMRKMLEDRQKTAPHDDYLLVDAIIDLDIPESAKLSDMVTTLFGGTHTVGISMTWGLYYLANNPEIQERLYEEIKLTLGEDEKLTADNIGKLVYMRQVLNETYRCSIMAPYAARVTDMDSELAGHRVPAGTPVLHALGVALHDERIFPEPTTFDPDRFCKEKEENLPPFSYEPFGFAGKRRCFGWKFGYIEASVMLSNLLRKFKFDLVPGQVVTSVYGLVTKPRDEIWVNISKRA